MQTTLDLHTSTESQEKKILAALQRGEKLTSLDLLYRFGSYQGPARIFYLKREGWPIKTEMVKLNNGKRVAQYSLETF